MTFSRRHDPPESFAPIRRFIREESRARPPLIIASGVCAGLIVLLAQGAYAGPQSALSPAGSGAETLADLFWVMVVATALIWAAVMGVAVYATRTRRQPHSERLGQALIVGGGIILPVIILTALLIHGLRLMPELRASDGGLRIEVSGEQWWWRVKYWPLDADAPIESANEVRLPRGERVEIVLSSPDVIHSFWIPSLAGKTDMIPGRTTRMVVEPTRPGQYRGVCAEFCGTSHALMAFSVIVMEPETFADWLKREAGPAVGPIATDGGKLFQAYGCGGCHRIRGTAAAGVIGPDLTHVGGRETIGAGILPNTQEAIARWISKTDLVKPGVRMPAFGMAPEADIRAIAGYLGDLK